MTATPPDPQPETTPGLEAGGGVAPGDTPPDAGQTSGLSHDQPIPSRRVPVVVLTIVAVLVVLVLGAIVVSIMGIVEIF
jgi:hypothetical protein